MVVQQMALGRASIIRKTILVGTAPRGGEDIMHLEKPSLARHLGDPTLKGYAALQKLFFAPTSSSQAAGGAFLERLARRKEDLDTPSGPDVAAAQMAAFREWEQAAGARFVDLKGSRDRRRHFSLPLSVRALLKEHLNEHDQRAAARVRRLRVNADNRPSGDR